MKCPKCKEQTLKEDYSDKRPNADKLYCPNCDYTESRAVVARNTIRSLEESVSHYSNNFMKALEALKLAHKALSSGCVTLPEAATIKKVIKELEEV